MRRSVVAGNWKMHGLRSANEALLADLEERIKPDWQVDVIVFPPYVYLADAVRTLRDGGIGVGAQDVCAEAPGAFTGQVAAAMLKDVGCRYVIVGHSERRRLYHEDDAMVARKFAAALAVGLIPVLCVGETLEEREAHRTEAVVARQLDAVTAMVGAASFTGAIVAYEPCGRSVRGAPLRRSRRRRCTRTCAVECPPKMLRWRPNCKSCTAGASRRQCARAVLDARRGRRFGGRRFVERR